jgi:small subunit ribosomal protein S4
MATRPRHKISRRFGFDVYGTGGPSLRRRLEVPPGARRGQRRRRPSDFGLQLREKQKTKAIYGVEERRFRRYVDDAGAQPGNRGDNLFVLLERRLDNVVYRLGYARSRPMARQLVSHGHVQVDGRRVTIPSLSVEPDRRIALTEAARRIPSVMEEAEGGRPLPAWLSREPDGSARVLRLPTREDVEIPADPGLILAYYSR